MSRKKRQSTWSGLGNVDNTGLMGRLMGQSPSSTSWVGNFTIGSPVTSAYDQLYTNAAQRYQNKITPTMREMNRQAIMQGVTPAYTFPMGPVSDTAKYMKFQDAFRSAGLDKGDMSADPSTAAGGMPKGAYNREASQEASRLLGEPSTVKMSPDQLQQTGYDESGQWGELRNNPDFWRMVLTMGARGGRR